ncbi:hypothetical protein NECAME_02988 [Necator americanus]|uniref:SXP/RAL-2 family protein Ani s 5-like cation-binding domain-containing protein n=1 Tax=Necator americanus TaxID=51031 RepID=W2T8S7_NECAM|nr:hypothetical protein NECAME_02988 [Necator americanus]ETN78029.1 hypothetical protein NECAME_02988 [Necator americanus]
MMKLFILIALAVTVFSASDGNMPDIPGVSAENMAKLRQMLNPRPANHEAFKQVIEQWKSTLSATEKAAATAHEEQMKKHKGPPGKRTA